MPEILKLLAKSSHARKPVTKANLELKNFRFYFAKTEPSYCMMNFSVLKSVSCMSLEAVLHLALQIEKSLGTEK